MAEFFQKATIELKLSHSQPNSNIFCIINPLKQSSVFQKSSHFLLSISICFRTFSIIFIAFFIFSFS